MSRKSIIAIVVAAIVVVVVGGWFGLRMLGRVSEADYAARFTTSCQDGVRQALMKAGKSGAEAQSRAESHCACAWEVIGPLSPADKREVDKPGSPRAREVEKAIFEKCAKNVSEAEYATDFTKGCEESARQSLIKDGKPAPEAEAESRTYCACALGVVLPMSLDDKRELATGGGERAKQIAADIKAKCLK